MKYKLFQRFVSIYKSQWNNSSGKELIEPLYVITGISTIPFAIIDFFDVNHKEGISMIPSCLVFSVGSAVAWPIYWIFLFGKRYRCTKIHKEK